MAINQLNDEQIATWTRLEKDTWWLENVYRGDMPQLTIRAAITGLSRDVQWGGRQHVAEEETGDRGADGEQGLMLLRRQATCLCILFREGHELPQREAEVGERRIIGIGQVGGHGVHP